MGIGALGRPNDDRRNRAAASLALLQAPQSSRLERRRIRAYQEKKLRSLIRHCWEYVPLFFAKSGLLHGFLVTLEAILSRISWPEDRRAGHYQFVQTDPNSVTVRLDRGSGFRLSEAEVVEFLRKRIAEDVRWNVVWGGAPELTVNGKALIIRNDWLRNQGLQRPR